MDFFGKPPRLRGDEWLPQSGGIASRCVVAQMKKTDREKDWPFVNGLAIQECHEGNMEGLLHLREISLLRQLWNELDCSRREQLSAIRPLLGILTGCEESRLERLLMIERGIWEYVNRERYLVYQHEWKEFYRRWQRDQVGQWPSSEPFGRQHHRVVDAVLEFNLPAAPILTPAQKQVIFNKGVQRAVTLFAASPAEIEAIIFPIDVILP